VTVIDGATNAVITEISVSMGAIALTYNPTENKVYCASYFGNNVTVIDGTSNGVITTIGVGDYPIEVVYNPTDNKVYCANNLDRSVTVIDGTTNGVITTITVDYGPLALVYNSLNDKVYCANNGGCDVTVIDGATNGVITTIAVNPGPRALAWNPAQNRIYTANFNSSSISVIRDVMGINEEFGTVNPAVKFFMSPNPFRERTTIHYAPVSFQRQSDKTDKTADEIALRIYNVTGGLVKKFSLPATRGLQPNAISWDGHNDRGQQLPSGVYLIKFSVDNHTETRKVLLIR